MELRQKSVSACIYHRLFDEARAKGTEQHLAETIGVGIHDIYDVNRRVSGDRHVAALRLASGWSLYWRNPPQEVAPWLMPFPELAGLVCNAATLRDALRQYAVYRELIGNVDWLMLDETGDSVALNYVLEGDGRLSSCAFANFAMLAAIARLYDPDVRIGDAEFTGPAFAPVATLQDTLSARMTFHAARNRIVLSSARLDAPFERFNGALAVIQRHVANEARGRLRSQASFGAAIERCVRECLRGSSDADAQPERLMQHVCERFAISRWTLRRRLHHEALTFNELVTRARVREATQLLLHTQLAIGEIGARVGFQSTSAFSRFFAREQGAAPSHYRDSRCARHAAVT